MGRGDLRLRQRLLAGLDEGGELPAELPLLRGTGPDPGRPLVTETYPRPRSRWAFTALATTAASLPTPQIKDDFRVRRK